MTGENKKTLQSLIDAYADRSLRTIGFIYRDFDSSWPPKGVRSRMTTRHKPCSKTSART